jgi:hypothetical protein
VHTSEPLTQPEGERMSNTTSLPGSQATPLARLIVKATLNA